MNFCVDCKWHKLFPVNPWQPNQYDLCQHERGRHVVTGNAKNCYEVRGLAYEECELFEAKEETNG